MERPYEDEESLWWLAAPPAVWAAHLLACYITAAIYCAKAPSHDVSLDGVRWVIALLSVLALASVAAIALRGLRRHRFDREATDHDFDTPKARHRFLGFASLLLSGVSAFAIVFAALPAIFMETCR